MSCYKLCSTYAEWELRRVHHLERTDMKATLNQLRKRILRGVRVCSKITGSKTIPSNRTTAKSTIEELWDEADFDALTNSELKPSNKADAKILNEAFAASRLLNNLNLYKSVNGRFIAPSETYKTVTILHSSLPHHPGGYSNRAQGLLKGISNLGVNLVGYTRPGFFRERVDKVATLHFPIDEVEGVTYHHLPDKVQRGRGEFQYMESCIEVYKSVFAEEHPNVVHVRSTYLIALPAIIAAKSMGIPIVYEISGLWELVYQGRGELGRANRAIKFENASVETATRCVTMNTAMSSLLRTRIGKPLEIGIVPNAVDLEKFAELPRRENQPEKYNLGYIGSLIDYEGLDLLLRAVAHLRDRGHEYTTKIVGKGHQLKPLQNLSFELGIDNLVDFTGPVQADQVQEHFAQIRTIVLPRKSTPATECVTPLKPFEAMASKRALITSDVSALNELSQDGLATTTFKAGDYKALAEAILNLENNESRREAQINTAYKLVENYHSWDNIAKIMESELRSAARAKYYFFAQDNG